MRRDASGASGHVLANVVLDELDWALERRGQRFARYADYCNIFVKSKRTGERLMDSVTRYLRDSTPASPPEHGRAASCE